MVLLFAFTSYFGRLNPHPSGMLSAVFIASLSLSIVLISSWFSRWIYASTVIGVWLVHVILSAGNWWYFQYFQTYFNYQSLSLIDDSLDSFRAISEFSLLSDLLWISGIGLVLAIISICVHSKPLTPIVKVRAVLIAFPLVITLVAAITLTVSFDRYRQLSVFTLSPSYVSPVHAFFVRESLPKALEKGQVAAELEFKSLNRKTISSGLDARPSEKLNVIVITLESIRASLMRPYPEVGDVTPHLNQFANENIKATQFYANTNFTVKGETAIWCGIFDYSSKPPYSKFADEIKNLECLPEILAREGYKTLYFHGNKSQFYNRDQYLPKIGFQQLEFFDAERRKEANLPEIGWGVSDEAMYGLMLDKLSGESEPFFAHITTLSSHYPFKWEWGLPSPDYLSAAGGVELFSNYLTAAHYEDYAFSKFWDAFRHSALASNTIVLVTSDHGIWAFDRDSEKADILIKNEQFFRMPLAIYHPYIDKPIEITQVGSQIDIPPTLLSMLGLTKYSSNFVGKDLLTAVEKPWAIMMKSGEVSVRVGNMLCSMASGSCGGAHQECMAKSYGEIYLGSVGELQKCYLLDGDPLHGGGYRQTIVSEDWLSKGLSLISLHNNRVFSEN